MEGRQRKVFTYLLLILCSFVFFGTNAFGQSIDSPQLVDRGPYLQRMTPNSVIIKWWVSTADIANNTIHYGTSPGSLLSTITDGSSTLRNVCGSRCDDFREFQVTINGLSSDTRYYYAVGTSTTPSTEESANGTFQTFPASGAKPTRVWVLGDQGTKDTNALMVQEAFQEYTQVRDPDVWILLGNHGYSNGSDRDIGDGLFFMYPAFLKNVAVWPVLGERDDNRSDSPSQSGPYYDIFDTPNSAQSGGVASGTQAYYSYDYGNIHFIALDSSDTSLSNTGSMKNWLTNDLNANTKEWTIAYFHASPYSKGWDDSDTGSKQANLRSRFVEELEDFGVDLVLTANSHAYERSNLINGHYGTSDTFNPATHQVDGGNGTSAPFPRADGAYHKTLVGGQPTANSGTVYAVVGSSGHIQTNGTPLDRSYQEVAGPLNHPAMEFSVNRLGSMVIDVYENRLEAIFLSGHGDISDRFTITHGNSNIAPEIFNASAKHPLTLEVQFSEPLEKISAENIGNYSINNGVTITAAQLQEDYRTVKLLTSPLDNSTEYILTVTNVEDHETNTAIPAPGSQYSFTPHFVNPPIHSISFQDGHYPHKGYDGTRDTYIYEGIPDNNYGINNNLIAHGTFEATPPGESIVMVSWDVSSIPSNAIIQSATFYWDPYNNSETPYYVRQLFAPWDEITVTWNNYGGDTNVGTEIIGTMPPEKFGMNPIPLTSGGVNMVQGWVDGSIPNYGLALRNAGPIFIPPSGEWWNAVRGRQRHTHNPPRLSVTYTLPTGADSIAPAIIAPPDIVVDSTGVQTPVSLGSAAAVDDNGVPSISNDAPAGGFPLGTTIVTWTATDGSGNTGTDTQKVTVRVPAATSPNTISFQDGVEPSAFYSGTQDSLLRETSPNQNKGDDPELWSDGVAPDPDVGKFGEVTSAIQWDLSAIPPNATVTSVEVSFNVFNDSPVNNNLYSILTPWTEENVTWNVAADPSVVGDDILGAIPPFTFNENIVTLNQDGIDLVQGWIDGSIENNGFFIQIAGSNNGMGVHSSEATTLTNRPKITISYTVSGDTEPPVVTAPGDITTPATGPLTPVSIGTATATDNVGVTSLTNNAPGGGFPAGVTVVTWTAMDAAGNIGTDTQTITVEDNVLPSITAPGDITTEATGPTTPVALGTPTTSDNVGVASVTNDAPAEFPVGATVVTWTVTDTSGNVNTDTQNVTVEDTTDPVVTAPGDITTTETGPLTPVNIGTATATDAVGVTSLTNDAPAGGFPQGTTIVTWTATDAAGNSGTDTQIIAVQAAGTGGPTTVSFQDGVEPDGSYAGTQDSLLRQSSGDSNYGNEASLSADLVQPDPSNGRFGEVISVVSWDISSIPNNATVDSASITLHLTNISSGSYNLYQALTSWDESTVTWNSFGGSSTNVGAAVIGTIVPGQFNENVIVLTPAGISLVEGWIDGSIANNGIVIKQINNNNDGIFVNSSEAATNPPKLTITYNVATTGDTEPPVVTAPADITVESTGPLTPVSIGTATATDNVGVVSLTNDAPAGGYPIGTTVVTWTALDAAANIGTDTQSITVTEPTTTGVNTTSFQNGVEPNGTYTGTQDALLRETSPDLNDNTDQLWADGISPDPNNGRFGEVVSVVSWDISAIPSDAIVSSVSVTFDMFNDSSGDHNILQATAPWSEDTVTWNSFGGTGSIGSTVLGTIGTFLFNEQEFILNADGVALVQGWVDGSIANNGLVIQSAGTNNGIGWNSSEAATGRPKITITYLVGGGTLDFQDGVAPNSGYSGTRDAHVRQPFPNNNYGSVTSLRADNEDSGGEVFSVISWDLSSIPSSATVNSVSITLDLSDGSGSTHNIWEVINSWSENTVTWNNIGPIGGTLLGSIPPTGSGEITINLNASGIALVQDWVDGSSANNGIIIRTTGSNDGIGFDSREATNPPKISVTFTLP